MKIVLLCFYECLLNTFTFTTALLLHKGREKGELCALVTWMVTSLLSLTKNCQSFLQCYAFPNTSFELICGSCNLDNM